VIQNALARAEEHLFELPLLEAFIAHRESGRQREDDPETVTAVVNELLSHQSEDGSWGGSVALTAEALLVLADLRIPGEKLKNLERAQQWLRKRRGVSGTYIDGCSADRHELAICEHFAAGFFSPAPPNRSLSGTRLANGLVFPTDADARLGLSALALHALLRWRRASVDDSLHLDALRRIGNAALRSNGLEVGVPTLILVLSVLTLAPRTPEFISVLHGALTRLAGTQRADGSWPNADPFHVAELYVEAHQAGYGSPVFDAAIVRTAELLVLTQKEDGSWGQEAGPYRLLSGWRTLRHAARLVTT
jgi:hypothetical protein